MSYETYRAARSKFDMTEKTKNVPTTPYSIHVRAGETIAQAIKRSWIEAGLPPNLFSFAMPADRFATLIALGYSRMVNAETLATLAAGKPGEPNGIAAEPPEGDAA